MASQIVQPVELEHQHEFLYQYGGTERRRTAAYSAFTNTYLQERHICGQCSRGRARNFDGFYLGSRTTLSQGVADERKWQIGDVLY